jgi:hypothetical protein
MSDVDEQQVQHVLSEWLETHTNAIVYWEQQSPYNYPRFSVRGHSGEKPDILLVGERTYAIEVKSGADSAAVYDSAAQLHRYFAAYEQDTCTYMVDGTPIDVDVFLIANKHSQEGRLFKESREFSHEHQKGEGGWWAYQKGRIPLREWNRTETVIRLQMRYANELCEDYTAGIGALLSSKLDVPLEQDPLAVTPKLLVYHQGEDWTWTKVR